jgi:asparagine synthase (glutamine-hydrolysing)
LQGLLLIDDKISMSHGLEVRVPFLDQDLVRFAQKLPNNLRINSVSTFENSSEAKEVQGKKLLRSLAGRIQNPVQFLPKTGFSGPDESWFRNESRSFVSDRLLDRKSKIWDNLDFQTGSKLVIDHLNGTSNNRLFVWSLLSLESTIRQFKL